jgi:transcriptional regulator with XRE-family HTH domain
VSAFGENLRELRRRKGLAQAELAEKVGLNRSSISTLETGKTQPRPGTIRALASALEVEPDELFEGPAGPNGQEARDDRLLMRKQYERVFSDVAEKLHSELVSIDTTDPQSLNALYTLFAEASLLQMQGHTLGESEPFMQEIEGETVEERRARRGVLEAVDTLIETARAAHDAIDALGTLEDGRSNLLHIGEVRRRKSMKAS